MVILSQNILRNATAQKLKKDVDVWLAAFESQDLFLKENCTKKLVRCSVQSRVQSKLLLC